MTRRAESLLIGLGLISRSMESVRCERLIKHEKGNLFCVPLVEWLVSDSSGLGVSDG